MSFSFSFSFSFSLRALAAGSLFALLVACSSHPSATTSRTECDALPERACGAVKLCETGGAACTRALFELPNGRIFMCASCEDCTRALDDALRACDGKAPSEIESATDDSTDAEADGGAPSTDGK